MHDATTDFRVIGPATDVRRWTLRFFVEFHLELYRLITPYFDGDIEVAVLAAAAVVSSGPDPFEGGDLPDFTTTTLIVASGLARTTVRRKLGRLVTLGFIEKIAEGTYRLLPAALLTPSFRALVEQIGGAIEGYFTRCLDHGFFRIVPDRLPDGDAPTAGPARQIRPIADEGRWQRLALVFFSFLVGVYRVRTSVLDDDLHYILIMDVVGLYTGAPFFNTPTHREAAASLDVLLGELQAGCTAQYIARETGLPRETVRRKLALMVERDYLTKIDNRYIHTIGVLRRPSIISAVLELEDAVMAMANHCLKERLFFVVDGAA
ncbi:hypothetical protein [Zavarzinia compransoris]|uniref:HTH iclR-type domain-containing protein n=1 Tax=Zavarzinia compransoris TaxID=1264899 RepID=A0A317DUJ0_9PROT|nr:hypothetical protein [Zavarzinia compransoris]PWR17526.1 hypothetical protein DKG75_22535 [Zavarzinia compransoris]TDP40361.1 hypothetical protein DES42_1166 [Zavarzinia compransoris]